MNQRYLARMINDEGDISDDEDVQRDWMGLKQGEIRFVDRETVRTIVSS